MFGRLVATVAAFLFLPAASTSAPPEGGDTLPIWSEEILFPAECEDWDEWDKPTSPFRVFGNTYYVGTCGITALLIESDDGLILIDGGTRAGADIVVRNIRWAGFAVEEVKLLLHSHEHFDHVGGLAALQRMSGARLLASPQAAPVLASGIAANDDPQAGMHEPFEAARVDGIIVPGEPVRLGNVELLPIATPGHTPGALSWQWQTCEAESHCRTIVYADSLSPISSDDYRFSDHPAYVADFRAGLARLAALDCDILLTPHPSAGGMRDKLVADTLAIPPSCRDYAAAIERRLDERLAREADDR